MTLFRSLTRTSVLFLDEIRLILHRYLGGVEQYEIAVQRGATLIDLKRHMNGVFHCFEDEQTYVLGPHRPVELEDDLLLHDLSADQREMIVLVHPAPVEHIPLALQKVTQTISGPVISLVLENLTDAQIEHLPSWLEHEAGHIQRMSLSATHLRIQEILSIVTVALPHLSMLDTIHLLRTAYAPSRVEGEGLLRLCRAATGRVWIRIEADVFHNSRKMCGDQLLRSARAFASKLDGKLATATTHMEKQQRMVM